jgi:hypothetical protein
MSMNQRLALILDLHCDKASSKQDTPGSPASHSQSLHHSAIPSDKATLYIEHNSAQLKTERDKTKEMPKRCN